MLTLLTLGITKTFHCPCTLKTLLFLFGFMLLPCWLNNNPVNGAGMPEATTTANTNIRQEVNTNQPTTEKNVLENQKDYKEGTYTTRDNNNKPITRTANPLKDLNMGTTNTHDHEEHHYDEHDMTDEEKHLRITLHMLLRLVLGLLLIVVFL